MILQLIYTFIFTLVVTVVLGYFGIPMLRRLHAQQSIREEGPKNHQAKAGTPTMGGLFMMLALIIGVLFMAPLSVTTGILLFLTLGHALLGFSDDFIKAVKKRNLGLTAKQKLAGQLVMAAIFCYIATESAGTGAVAAISYAVIGLLAGLPSVAFYGVALCGAALGFLYYNMNPAKVFMGDTGSLALGGAFAGMAIMTKTELLLVIIGGIFVMEALSVIIQVASFKTRGVRVFKMSPIHHHFELSGWGEQKVVTRFWLGGCICAIVGLTVYVVQCQ